MNKLVAVVGFIFVASTASAVHIPQAWLESDGSPKAGDVEQVEVDQSTGLQVERLSNRKVRLKSRIGTVTDTKWCTGTSGGVINCTSDEPTVTETDPQVGAVTVSGNVCVADGDSVECTLTPNAGTNIANDLEEDGEIGAVVVGVSPVPGDDKIIVGASLTSATWVSVDDSNGTGQCLQYDQATNDFIAFQVIQDEAFTQGNFDGETGRGVSQDDFYDYVAQNDADLDGLPTSVEAGVALDAETYSTAASVTAGTNAQGQGALTADYSVITTASSNPSGVTLPTATTGRRLIVINKGANAVNVYPATSAAIDAGAANAAISLPVNTGLTFNASSTTQWYSSLFNRTAMDPGANGLIARTAANTTAARTITGNTQVSVSNGDGVSGNPTLGINNDSIGPTQFDETQSYTYTSIQNFASVKVTGDIAAAITASQNNWDPSGWGTNGGAIRISANGAYNITGLAGGADGRVAVLLNEDTTDSVTLVNESGSSTAGNRFLLGANIVLAPNQGLTLIYDSTATRWRSMATAQVHDTQIEAGAVDGGVGGEIADDSIIKDDLSTTVAADVASYRYTGSTANRYYAAAQAAGSNFTALSITSLTMYAMPYYSGMRGGTVDRFAYGSNGGAVAGNCRVCMYSNTSSTNLYPNALISGSDSGDISPVGFNGTAEATVNLTLTKDTLYWFVLHCSITSGTFSAVAVGLASTLPILGGQSTIQAASSMGTHLQIASQTYQACPSTFPAGATIQNGITPPVVAVRYSG